MKYEKKGRFFAAILKIPGSAPDGTHCILVLLFQGEFIIVPL